HSAKGQEWRAVFVLNVVDGCIPSDMSTGNTEEIEEERRLLYVAMTRAKDPLMLLVPQRFYVPHQAPRGDKHPPAGRTRFTPPAIAGCFQLRTWPLPASGTGRQASKMAAKIDLGARMRGMWRGTGT